MSQQQLEAAQAQIQHYAQQLAAERDAASKAYAQLQGQLEQQQRHITQIEAQAHRLRWIINTSPATTYSCEATPPYLCTYISQSIEAVLGYTPPEFKAEPDFWEQRLHPEDAPGVFAAIPQLFEQGKLQHDYRIRHRDGHYVWIRDTLMLFRDAQGLPEVVGYFTDISEQKRSDAERKQTEQRIEQELQRIAQENRQFRETLIAQEATYRHLFDCNPQPMWVYDLETLRFLAVNAAAIAKYGYSSAEFLAMTIADIRPLGDVPRLLEHVTQLDSGPDMADIWQHRLRDGQVIQVKIVSYALEFEGRRAELVMAQDVTQRVAAEQALCDLNRTLEQTVAERTADLYRGQAEMRAILNNSPAKIYVEDLEGRYIFVNQTFLRLFNCQFEDVIGKTAHEFFPPEIADTLRMNDLLLLEQGGVQQFEELVRVNGEDRVFLSNKFLLRDEQGEVYALCGMSTDITDRKAMEVALQASCDHLQAILAALPDHVFRVNREGIYLDFYPSDSTLEITGLDTLVGRTMTEVLPPDVAQAHLYRIEQVLNTKAIHVSEQQVEVGGALLVREVRVAPCGSNEVLFVIRDITERKQNETQLKRQLAAIEAAVNGIAIVQDDTFLSLNQAHLKLFGYTQAEELIGQPWTVLYSPEELSHFEQEVKPILARDGVWVGEVLATRKDGILFHEGLSLTLTEDGLMICVCEDISDRKRTEASNQQLLQELAGFKLALDESAIVAVTDDQGVIIDANDKFCKISGYSREELIGQTHRLVNSGYHSAYYFRDLWRTIASGQVWRGEICNRAKAGTWYWVDSTMVPFLDCEARPERYLSIQFDITDRKQAEIELRDLTSRLTLALQAGAYGTWDWDLVSDAIWDERMYEIHGLQDLGRNATYQDWRDLVHPDDIGSVEAQLQAAVRGAATFNVEFRIWRTDGELRWIRAVASTQYDTEGNPVRVVGINYDNTDRKQAEQSLQASENRFRRVFSSNIVGMMFTDFSGQVLDANDRFLHLLGYTRADLETQAINWATLTPQEHQANDLKAMEQLRLYGMIEPWEKEYYRKDGSRVAVLIGVALFDESDTQCVCVVLDISYRKQIELDLQRTNAELARATRLKDEFLANMSHELRTPLNAILGLTEGLQEEVFGPITDRQRRSLTTIETSGDHLLSLINDVLDVAKIESGQLELDYAAVNVCLLCNSSLTLVKQQAHKKRLHIETHVSKSLPEIYGDERRLRQMLVNLLSNAVKFTPEGGRITVSASYKSLTPAEIALNQDLIHPEREPYATVGVLMLSVADTGIGINPEDAKKLFQPFIQIDSSLNRQYQGTGLGLALVKRIAEIHGGKVALTSVVGSGSCFTLQLPIIPILTGNFSATAPASSLEAAPLDPVDPATAPLILLVEDNAANVSTITAYLTAKGYSLIVAQNGLEAVNLATSAHPNLILMDIQMPQLDGLEAIRQIRQNSALAAVPIVALTALAMPDDRERCLAAGADDYISKPIRLKQLAQAIQTLLAKPPTE
ncbi:MAG: PAS domain S-box protein [Leptolyngbya sp. DLM2.Bin27]|nr:MAG: PAS domain S-box protein [Leptolyngbya sp. DLM2.Bin27]